MKTLESFSFNNRSGRTSGHDWETLFNGSIWCMESGVDFTSKPQCFHALAKRHAKNLGYGLKLGYDGDNVVLQAYKLNQQSETPVVAVSSEPAVEQHEPDASVQQEQQEHDITAENNINDGTIAGGQSVLADELRNQSARKRSAKKSQ